LISGAGLVAVMIAAIVAISGSAGAPQAQAQAPATSSPNLVSATILANNFRQDELSTVQFTFDTPVTLNGTPSTYLSKFSLGTGTHPTTAVVEGNGFVVEANFPWRVNVGLFENATADAGAVVATQGNAPNASATQDLTVTTQGATSAPDFRGAVAPGASTNELLYFFDKPVERVEPEDFGFYLRGNPTPVMGTSVPSGGFKRGSTVVTIEFPSNVANTASAQFVLSGGAVGKNGQSNPDAANGANVSGVPGLLSASGENVASVTRVDAKTFAFTFTEAAAAAMPGKFLVYTADDGRFAGSKATVSGKSVQVRFPAIKSSSDVVHAAVLAGAITGATSNRPSSVGSQPIGPPAGSSAGSSASRGVGFTPTGPSVTSNPDTIADAPCGPGDAPETGLQGQVPPAVRAIGFQGFNCNLSLLGQFPAKGVQWDGGTWVGSWAGDCAYLSTMGHGVIVVDASDPAHPTTTETLTPPAFLHTWESLKYNPKRHLLAATSAHDPFFSIYDVRDCAHPTRLASLNLGPNDNGHAGTWAPDGKTYYGTQFYRGVGGVMAIIDTTDASHPRLIENYPLAKTGMSGDGRPHDISFNTKGTIAYVNQPGQFGNTQFPGPNGLVVLNVKQVQRRVPNPKIRVMSTLFWNDSGQGQQTLPVTYNGQSYVITTDESGSGGVAGRAGACARGLSPFGFTRIINASNPRKPFIVSKLRLAVDDPRACLINDDAPDTGSFGYDSHYCGVNRTDDPTMLGCGYFESGLRVFDIAKPDRPKEIAYYNPSPGRGTDSEHANSSPVGFTQTDWASSPVVFVGCNVWDQFQDNGYLFLQFTHGPGKQLCTVDSSSADEDLG
jgi:hypothetical protein